MSLRLRLAVAIASVVALVTIVLGLVVYDRERTERISRARDAAVTQVQVERRLYEDVGGSSDFTGSGRPDQILILEDARVGVPVIPEALREKVIDGFVATILTRWTGRTFDGQRVVIAGTRVSDGDRLYVVQSYEGEEAGLRGLRLTLIRVVVAATILGALLGVLIATLLARPLARSAALARRLAAGDLEARVQPEGTDEIADLGRALNEMADALSAKIHQLDEAAAREQRFSADVAHELRTPVTGIVAAASLLDDSPAASMVRERAAKMAALVQDLLEVMRLEAGAELPRTDSFDLVKLARDVVAQRNAGVEVMTPEHVRVRTDPRRVERILGNLIDNALRYGRPPVQVLIEEDGRLTVRDHGPGFGPFLERAGNRFAMADSARGGGTGLGLAIARGQAAVLGAELDLHDDHGAVATLRLPVDTITREEDAEPEEADALERTPVPVTES